jgi:hypothetical protein
MNQRISKIIHPAGIELNTPLLVPSYSSKGFQLYENGESEIQKIMAFSNEFIYESQLISAYDIYYKHLPLISDLKKSQVTLIDSGGYETSDNYDLSETKKYSRNGKVWNLDLLNKVIDEWNQSDAAILINFDDINSRKSFQYQIQDAIEFFERRKLCLSDFLIKPEQKEDYFLNIQSIVDNIKDLRYFDIIGFTEKELGDSIISRMLAIYKIRTALNGNNIQSPIHIFGTLDPICVTLYFMAGAEIFDGLTWLKYAYVDGLAIYNNNSCFINEFFSIYLTDDEIRKKIIKNNIYYLEMLKMKLSESVISGDFACISNLFSDKNKQLFDRCLGIFLFNL